MRSQRSRRSRLTHYLTGSLLAATAISAPTCGNAADFYPIDGYPNSIYMDGDINLDDEKTLEYALATRLQQGLTNEYLVLNSAGGRVLPASNMAKIIREHGISTVVYDDGECASACMLMFAAGKDRYVYDGAKLGVHSVSGKKMAADGSELAWEEQMDGTVWLAREMKFYGTPASVLGKLVTTTPDDMSFLTMADLEGWVTVINPTNSAPKSYTMTQPNNPTTTNPLSLTTLTCQSTETGAQYMVYRYPTSLQVNGSFYAVTEQHAATKEYGAWVVSGPTRYGTYAAIFGGPNPRMAYVNTKGEHALDRCW